MIKTIEPHTPLQYIIGKEKFFGLDFMVNEHVLIPRPETEVLVETSLHTIDAIRNTQYAVRILDLCTGSGNIAISLMVRLGSPSSLSKIEGLTKNAPNCRMFASDISEGALEVAKENARLNGVFDNITFIKSNLFKDIEGRFDLIVSNPPYIARNEFDTLPKEVLKEPRSALDGGPDGLDFYRRIFLEAPRYLKPEGYCLTEIGFGQLSAIEDMIGSTKGFKLIEVRKDQYAIDRVIVAQWIN
jgi:release factor glutamine methyltransferase